MSARLDELLRGTFRGSTLQPPAFDGLSFVRFELGDELHGTERVDQAVDRATSIYEALFSSTDRGLLVGFFWRAEHEKALQLLAPVDFERTESANFWNDPDGADRFARLVAPVLPREVDYATLFRQIANLELGLRPAIGGQIFVVGETVPVIFKMYDDRGAVVHAPAPEHLAGLEQFRAWEVGR